MPITAVGKTRTGNLKLAKRDGSALFVRMTPEEKKEFEECVLLDADIHGGEVNQAVVVRKLVRAFCRATRHVAGEPVAVDGAKVLRKVAR